MADPRTVAGNIQDEPGASCSARKKGNAQKPPTKNPKTNPLTMMGVYQKDPGAS